MTSADACRRCEHSRDAHRHHSSGGRPSYCGMWALCDCRQFRSRRSPLQLVRSWLAAFRIQAGGHAG